MSDLLRVLPDDLRAAASDLLQLSGEVSHVQSAVRHHWSRLDAGWQSYARAGVDAQYEETVREIERMALMLEQLGAALVKTAEIIAAADRDAAAFFSVGEVKPSGGKAPGLACPVPGDVARRGHANDGGIRPGDLPVAEAQLALARIENVQLIQ
ncbi:MAG TPA: WXG100 family type VII secretion target, partial [Anaerolineae bacterium]|nr:WXG100 family type VII secretion target [Anaerolineae bacterium]